MAANGFWQWKHSPCNEENPTLLAILVGDEIKVINSIPALIGRKASSEVLITLGGLTKLLHNDLFLLLFNFEYNEAVCSFSLRL